MAGEGRRRRVGRRRISLSYGFGRHVLWPAGGSPFLRGEQRGTGGRAAGSWHLLAELYSFAGEQQKALDAVEKGRPAGGFPEDWDRLEQMILAGDSLEAMEKTRIRNMSARAGEQGSLLEKCRLEATDGLVCDRAGLEGVMSVLKRRSGMGMNPTAGSAA